MSAMEVRNGESSWNTKKNLLIWTMSVKYKAETDEQKSNSQL